MIWSIEKFRFLFGEVFYDDLYRIEDGHASDGLIFEVLANAVFKKGIFIDPLPFGYTRPITKFVDSFRSVSTSTKTGYSWHSWVVPSMNVPL